MSTSSSSRPGARRVVSPTGAARSKPRDQAVVPRLLFGALAGVQSGVFTYLCVVVPAIAAFISTSADSSVAAVTWTDAARTGTDLWLWMHGAALTVHVSDTATATISAWPLGLALVAVWACQFWVRTNRQASAGAQAACVAGYVAVVGVLGGLVGTQASRGGLVRAMALAALMSWLGAWWGARRLPTWRVPAWVPTWVGQVPGWLATGVRAAAMALLGIIAGGAVVFALWMVLNAGRMGALFSGLRPDALGSIVLILGQLTLVPNLAIWGAAYLLGPGFRVGEATLFSPWEVSTAPMPAIPVLGALPDAQPQTWNGLVMAIPMVVGACVGWWIARRVRARSWPQALGACAAAGVATAAGYWLVGFLASGAAGPGRLNDVGPRLTACALAALVAVAVATFGVVGLDKGGVISWVGARLPWSAARAQRAAGRLPDPQARAARQWHIAGPVVAPNDEPPDEAPATPLGAADDEPDAGA